MKIYDFPPILFNPGYQFLNFLNDWMCACHEFSQHPTHTTRLEAIAGGETGH
jgi:hypothetical protein